MDSKLSGFLLEFCDRKEREGETITPKELKEIIHQFYNKIAVFNVEEADYVFFDLDDAFESVDGIMTDYHHPIFTSYEHSDNGTLAIENKYGDIPVQVAIEKVKEQFPETQVKFFKSKY